MAIVQWQKRRTTFNDMGTWTLKNEFDYSAAKKMDNEVLIRVLSERATSGLFPQRYALDLAETAAKAMKTNIDRQNAVDTVRAMPKSNLTPCYGTEAA